MREEGKVRAARCLRLELVGDAAAAVMDVAEAELAAAGAALADLAFVAVQVGRARWVRRVAGDDAAVVDSSTSSSQDCRPGADSDVGAASMAWRSTKLIRRVTVKWFMHCLHVMLSFGYDENVTGGFAGVRRR